MQCVSFKLISKKDQFGLMRKGRIFSDWNGEVFTSICQTTDLVELNNSGVYSSFFRPELYLTLDKK